MRCILCHKPAKYIEERSTDLFFCGEKCQLQHFDAITGPLKTIHETGNLNVTFFTEFMSRIDAETRASMLEDFFTDTSVPEQAKSRVVGYISQWNNTDFVFEMLEHILRKGYMYLLSINKDVVKTLVNSDVWFKKYSTFALESPNYVSAKWMAKLMGTKRYEFLFSLRKDTGDRLISSTTNQIGSSLEFFIDLIDSYIFFVNEYVVTIIEHISSVKLLIHLIRRNMFQPLDVLRYASKLSPSEKKNILLKECFSKLDFSGNTPVFNINYSTWIENDPDSVTILYKELTYLLESSKEDWKNPLAILTIRVIEKFHLHKDLSHWMSNIKTNLILANNFFNLLSPIIVDFLRYTDSLELAVFVIDLVKNVYAPGVTKLMTLMFLIRDIPVLGRMDPVTNKPFNNKFYAGFIYAMQNHNFSYLHYIPGRAFVNTVFKLTFEIALSQHRLDILNQVSWYSALPSHTLEKYLSTNPKMTKGQIRDLASDKNVIRRHMQNDTFVLYVMIKIDTAQLHKFVQILVGLVWVGQIGIRLAIKIGRAATENTNVSSDPFAKFILFGAIVFGNIKSINTNMSVIDIRHVNLAIESNHKSIVDLILTHKTFEYEQAYTDWLEHATTKGINMVKILLKRHKYGGKAIMNALKKSQDNQPVTQLLTDYYNNLGFTRRLLGEKETE